jgi:hypothetical protein
MAAGRALCEKHVLGPLSGSGVAHRLPEVQVLQVQPSCAVCAAAAIQRRRAARCRQVASLPLPP